MFFEIDESEVLLLLRYANKTSCVVVKRNVPMERFINSYLSWNNLQDEKTRFMYKGEYIKWDKSPMDYRMMNGDMIYASVNKAIVIKVCYFGKEDQTFAFQLNRNTPMAKVLNAYADLTGVAVGRLRFFLDAVRISFEDTPDSLGLENDDTIDAAIAMH